MAPIMQTDVYGRCPVSLETTQEPNGSWLVKKSKDVNQCKHLHGQDFTIKTDPFQTDGVSNTSLSPNKNFFHSVQNKCCKQIKFF